MIGAANVNVTKAFRHALVNTCMPFIGFRLGFLLLASLQQTQYAHYLHSPNCPITSYLMSNVNMKKQEPSQPAVLKMVEEFNHPKP